MKNIKPLATLILTLVVGPSVSCTPSYAGVVRAMEPPASVAPEKWGENYATVREQWIEYMKVPAHGREVMDWRDGPERVPPAYQNILQRYLWAIQDQWMKRGEFRFIVLDEDGQPVDDATREVWDFVKLGGDLEPRFQVSKQHVIGEQRIKLKPNMQGLEVHLRSTGHRWIQFRLPMGPDYGAAHEMLESGIVLPPLAPDGPVRVVMPFRYRWENGKREDSDGGMPFELGKGRPETDPSLLDLPAIVSSDDPGYAPTPKRGLYARIDRDGKVWNYVAYNAGALLGLHRSPGDYHNPNGWAIMTPGGGGRVAPESGAPYKWVLVAEPTRIPPDEVRAAYDGKRKKADSVRIAPGTTKPAP